MNKSQKVNVPQTAKGHRPSFFDDPVNDKIISMITSIVTEIWVNRERLDTIETIMEEKGLCLNEEIENFKPSRKTLEKRENMRQELLDRIFYIFQEEVEDTARGDTKEMYETAVNISSNAN